MKPPRKLQDYTTAEEAACGLENMAAELRAHAPHRPMVKYLVHLSFWNPDWADRQKPRPQVIVTGANYGNTPKETRRI